MPDIAMCRDKDCPKKEKCYRYMAKPSEYWQTYLGLTPRKENGDCDFYWKLKKENKNENN